MVGSAGLGQGVIFGALSGVGTIVASGVSAVGVSKIDKVCGVHFGFKVDGSTERCPSWIKREESRIRDE